LLVDLVFNVHEEAGTCPAESFIYKQTY